MVNGVVLVQDGQLIDTDLLELAPRHNVICRRLNEGMLPPWR